MLRYRDISWLYFVDANCEVVVACQLWSSRFFAFINPCCEEFLWKGACVAPRDFPNVSSHPPVNKSIYVRDIAQETSHFFVFDNLLSDLTPFYSEDSSNSSVMKDCELAEVTFSKIPRFASQELSSLSSIELISSFHFTAGLLLAHRKKFKMPTNKSKI